MLEKGAVLIIILDSELYLEIHQKQKNTVTKLMPYKEDIYHL
jgi:hypothetical protein